MLPSSEKHKSRWPFLSKVRVVGAFDPAVVPAGVLLTDSPGFGDDNKQQTSACEHALKLSSLVLHVVDCNHFLQPSTALALIRAVRVQSNTCVVVSKFLDTVSSEQLKSILTDDLMNDEFDNAASDDQLRQLIGEQIATCFRSLVQTCLQSEVVDAEERASLQISLDAAKLFFVSARSYLLGDCQAVSATGISKLQEHLHDVLVSRRLTKLRDVAERLHRLWTEQLSSIVPIDATESIAISWFKARVDALIAELQSSVRASFRTLSLMSIPSATATFSNQPAKPHHETLYKALSTGKFTNIAPFVKACIEICLQRLETPSPQTFGITPEGLSSTSKELVANLLPRLTHHLMPDGTVLRAAIVEAVCNDAEFRKPVQPSNKKLDTTLGLLATNVMSTLPRAFDAASVVYCRKLADLCEASISECASSSAAKRKMVHVDVCKKFVAAVERRVKSANELYNGNSDDSDVSPPAPAVNVASSSSSSSLSLSPSLVAEKVNGCISALPFTVRQFLQVYRMFLMNCFIN